MPQLNLTEDESRLVDILKQYHENHKYFYRSMLDCCLMFDYSREKKFNNMQYVGKLALEVARNVCLTNELDWGKVLKKHGMYSGFAFNNTADYLPIIIRALQKLKIDQGQQPCLRQAIRIAQDPDQAQYVYLRQAIRIAKDPDYSALVEDRIKLIREYSDAKLKPKPKPHPL